MKRIMLAGLLGGLALFIWEFVAHDVLPLGTAGFQPLANEPDVQAALKQRIKDDGLYFFPAPKEDVPGMSSQQKREAMMNAVRTGPVGLLVLHPNGVEMVMPKLLGTQFAVDLALMLLAALLLSWTVLKSYGSRLMFVTLLALFPVVGVQIPMWNWYGFPTAYLLAQSIEHLAGFFLGGLVVAWMMRPTRAA